MEVASVYRRWMEDGRERVNMNFGMEGKSSVASSGKW